MRRPVIDQLRQWRDRSGRKPLVLRGARQVGKTYALKQFGQECFAHCHYLNFEREPLIHAVFSKDYNPRRILDELAFHLGRTIDPATDLLILDEIQECPDALTSLKYFAEEQPELAVCAAGSLLGLSLGSQAFPVGKVEFLNLYPLSFREFLMATRDVSAIEQLDQAPATGVLSAVAHAHLWTQLKRYMVTGGLPEIVMTYAGSRASSIEAFAEVRRRQRELASAYLADMAKHCGKQNAMHLERIWSNVPEQLARAQDGNTSKYAFKGVVPGIKGYDRLAGAIDWLETAGLLIRVSIAERGILPLSAWSKDNTFKLYLFDIGILGAIADLPPQTILDYDYGSYKGFVAENFVAQELLAAGHSSLYAWKENESELEFLLVGDNSVIPVEVKAGASRRSRSLSVYRDKYHPLLRIILSGDGLQLDAVHGVQHCPLYLAGRLPLPMAAQPAQSAPPVS